MASVRTAPIPASPSTDRAPAGTPPGEGFPAPEWIRGGVLYSLFPRAFTPEGTLEAARLRLPEIRVLGADAVINIPKLKTHKKSGVTLALKSCIGLTNEKYWLPHYTAGTPAEDGDEFPFWPPLAVRSP